ncbi:hypothetical protein D3C86_2085760 [compost metagenome]
MVITEPEFISEPVAAIVSTVASGSASVAAALRVGISQKSPSYLAPTAIAFAQSITLPPPTARIRSILLLRQSSTPR